MLTAYLAFDLLTVCTVFGAPCIVYCLLFTVTKTVKLRELLDKKGTVNLQHLHLVD